MGKIAIRMYPGGGPIDVLHNGKIVARLPGGTDFRVAPNGDGLLAAHLNEPIKWLRSDGTIEEIKP